MLTYNDRLFKQKFRKDFHFARFFWLQNHLNKIDFKSVFELGCYDAKTLDFIENQNFEYTGFDDDWEGGLKIAIKKYEDNPNVHFIRSNEPEDILTNSLYDISICLETFEHLPTQQLELFIKNLSRITVNYSFFSVPNESGPIFLFRHIIKIIFKLNPEPYTFKEIFWQTIGTSNNVIRSEGSHKGFDYKKVIEIIEKYYKIKKVESIPFSYLPIWLGFNVGIVCEKK